MYAVASDSKTVSRATAWAASLVLCLGANALAANNSVTGCEDSDRPGPGPAISVDILSISLIEHITVTPEDELSQSPRPIEIRLQSDAPVMSLSPRVATMLDRIFEDSSGAAIAAAERKKTMSGEPGSPLADGQTAKPVVNDDQELALDQEVKLPELQQKMYRRDI